MSKVNPQELIVLHKEDFEYLKSFSKHSSRFILTYDLNRFREEAYDEGIEHGKWIFDEFGLCKKPNKELFLTQPLEI